MDTDTLLPERLNHEPPLLNGCARSELGLLLAGCAAGWLPLAFLLAVASGIWLALPGALFAGTLLSTWCATFGLARLKQHRPPRYPLHWLTRALARRGLVRSRLVWRSGRWDLLRA